MPYGSNLFQQPATVVCISSWFSKLSTFILNYRCNPSAIPDSAVKAVFHGHLAQNLRKWERLYFTRQCCYVIAQKDILLLLYNLRYLNLQICSHEMPAQRWLDSQKMTDVDCFFFFLSHDKRRNRTLWLTSDASRNADSRWRCQWFSSCDLDFPWWVEARRWLSRG